LEVKDESIAGDAVVKRTELNAAYFPVIVLHDADTGRRVCVNGLWFTSITEGEHGTIFRFMNNESVTVDESLDDVTDAFQRMASR
jgi:hypothetical protein